MGCFRHGNFPRIVDIDLGNRRTVLLGQPTQVSLFVLNPSFGSRSTAGFLKKGLTTLSSDSARARVAVCRQARKLAMSVAENMGLIIQIPEYQPCSSDIQLS